MRTLACLVAVAGLATGCERIGLADSVDLTFDWNPLPSDELHTPYVAGADFSLFTTGVDEDDREGWSIESADPSILRVDSTADGAADVTATGAGETTIIVRDERGTARHEAPIEVRQANRAELFAHGGLIIGRPELQEDWDTIHVLVGGQATFEVRWFDGEERLFGHGALSATSSTGEVIVEPRRTFLFEDREWVTFSPQSPGEHEVTLLANGTAVRTVRVVGVEAGAVDHVELHGMDESAARDGDLLTVLAQAYDAEERAIFGVEFAWDLDGNTEDGFGDLYRYTFRPGTTHMLGAHFGELDVQAMIQGEEGFVDSTNRLFCSVTHVGLRTAGFPLASLLVLALVLRRRRRS